MEQMMAKKEKTPVEQLTYEQAYVELEDVVMALEANPKSLDEATALFERGQALAKHCAELLDKAELRVRQLTASEMNELDEDAEDGEEEA
jgi:exodeoxyribonuclease VII small subunit